jgi:hypothetical protein
VGWKGPDIDPASVNVKETLVATTGAGVRRIPIQGIQAGHPAGRPPRKDDRSPRKKEPLPRTDVDPGGESTTEAADTGDGGRAIVLIPKRLADTSKVEVLFHLHGQTIGYRQSREHAQPADEGIYRIEQQLDASKRPMIAVLPQGDIGAFFWRGAEMRKGKRIGKPPVFNVDDYIREALDKVPKSDWPKETKPTAWSVLLSGHSGAGAAFTAFFKDESRLPKNLIGIVQFDAVNQLTGQTVSQIEGGGEYNALKAFLLRRLDEDLAKVKAVAAEPAATLKQRQAAALESGGFQFRAFFHGTPNFADRKHTALDPEHEAGYADRYWMIEQEVIAWLARHRKDVGVKGDPVFDALRKNYTFTAGGAGVTHMGIMGKHLESALTGVRPRP